MAKKLLIFSLAFICINATPTPPAARNTIFIDEQLEGQIFEAVKFTSEIDNYNGTYSPSDFRLPTTTKPNSYDVLWVIDMTRLVFTGEVTIYLVATQANVSEIVIHAASDLSIGTVRLQQGATVIPQTISRDDVTEFLVITPSTVLQYNAADSVVYSLYIEFNAELRRNMQGLYRSWYRNTWNDAVRWMATTQFQATQARGAFPCYDEPSFKAVFNIRIRRPTGFRSWSCTRLDYTDSNIGVTGYEDDYYLPTPIMSTYLIALIVAEYESVPAVDSNNTLVYEVITRPGALDQSDYAFEVGQKLLAAMDNHTGIPFLSMSQNLKMTQASIPDFSAGAMENWGLLTYREAYLMYDEEHTHDNLKQIIAYILSHEIAHMWFGNLVTCDWWNNLWLNEGFARYYQYYLTHWVEDYMGFDTRFIVEQVHTSMLADSANNPHPLYHPAMENDPDAVWDMFSTISYNKGACIIRMTEHLLGFEVNRLGLQNYLAEKSFTTALPTDLSGALHNAAVSTGAIAAYGSDFSVVDYYKTWYEQPGVPVVNVQVDHQTGSMLIKQARFNINTGISTDNLNWQIPITFASASNPDFTNTKPTHILRGTTMVINRGSVGDEWVIFNKQQTGYYRVNYDPYTWDLIILALRGVNRTQIHEYNRAQIVDDVFQFARSGLMNYTRAFNILSFLEGEQDYAPWVAALSGFSWLRNRLAGTTTLTTLEAQIARWATPLMNSLTYRPIANESWMRSYLRRQLAPVMCNMNVPECIAAANTQFQALVVSGTEVPVNNRNWVYCNGLRAGLYTDFQFMLRRYNEHNVYSEKIQLLQTLGCTSNAVALNELLNLIVSENYVVRPQDYSTTFNNALTGNEANTQIVFNFIQQNLEAVSEAFYSPATPLANVASRLRTPAQVTEFQEWLNQTQTILGGAYYTAYSAADSALASIAFAEQIQGDLNNYFVNGDDQISGSTVAPTQATTLSTSARPGLEEPVTPQLPDSAVTTAVSAFALTIAVLINRFL
ncbi:membrane alanyl aminopeptidase-like [Leptidea sinapis]|uniref:membrane alanyl aminopeptidase-like n=1 Tax=Leptidea sinapis TaxID=189913 RepID=UPI0021C4BC45|nr:membrane alanyl aminopeptidase-like [Leptidea sinapis]